MNEIDLQTWLESNGYGSITSSQGLSGGDICKTERVITSTGHELCIKQRNMANPAECLSDFFEAEARGLVALQEAQLLHPEPPLRIPKVFGFSRDFIAMEYIATGKREGNYWQLLARGLAATHSLPAPFFGFEKNNYCGLTPQKNNQFDDGFRFFAEQRLGYQAEIAVEKGFISSSEQRQIKRLAEKLPELLPFQPPSLIHGDLWSGNILCDSQGQPVLIDPACHYGWAEADLAMTRLFGGFPERFYQAYSQAHPMESGWQDRVSIYNLYHLLNHLNLFGGGYYQQVMAVVKRFGPN